MASAQQSAPADEWRIKKMPGFRITHPFMAVAPGCPIERHPTRWCKCKVHRTSLQAQDYIDEQKGQDNG